MLSNPRRNISASDHVAGIQDNSLADNDHGEEAIGNNLKVYGTPEGNHHTKGIQPIVDPTLVPIPESSNKRPQTLL